MSGKTYTPLRYPGGKTQVYEFVKELIKENNCHTYIEPYMGGAGVAMKLLLLGDVEKIIVNDYDKSIYAFWYSVLYLTEELIDKIENTDITIDEWKIQKSIQDNKNNVSDLLLLGFSTLFLNRTNRSGIIKAGVIGGKNQNGKYKLDCRFSKSDIINKILEISKHKKQIKLFNMDAEQFIKRSISKTKNSFTFFDPPYYTKGPGLYTNFYNHDDHSRLSKTIKDYMKDKKWILTYDIHKSIEKMYEEYRSELYYLNYSVSTPNKGIERIFYSDNLHFSQSRNKLKIVD